MRTRKPNTRTEVHPAAMDNGATPALAKAPEHSRIMTSTLGSHLNSITICKALKWHVYFGNDEQLRDPTPQNKRLRIATRNTVGSNCSIELKNERRKFAYAVRGIRY